MTGKYIPNPKLEVRGGNSGFVKDGLVYSTGNDGCLRWILLRAHGVEEPINKQKRKTFRLGEMNEDVFVENYLEDIPITRQLDIVEPVNDVVTFIGHPDVITEDTVYELKAISSTKQHWKVIKCGQYKISNLAQNVAYMVAARKQKGMLCYSSYVWGYARSPDRFDEYNMVTPEDHMFQVKFADDGRIVVDGVPTEFTLYNQLEHRTAAAKVLQDVAVYPHRPINSQSPKDNPCQYCPVKSVCRKHDKAPMSGEEFINQSREVINGSKVSES